MYILYYLTKNLTYGTLEVETLNAPILIPEDLIFTDVRKGITFIKEPNICADFTHLERLFMQSQLVDTETLKDGDYRRANTYLNPLCQVDLDKPYLFEPTITYRISSNRRGTGELGNYSEFPSSVIPQYSFDGVTFYNNDALPVNSLVTQPLVYAVKMYFRWWDNTNNVFSNIVELEPLEVIPSITVARIGTTNNYSWLRHDYIGSGLEIGSSVVLQKKYPDNDWRDIATINDSDTLDMSLFGPYGGGNYRLVDKINFIYSDPFVNEVVTYSSAMGHFGALICVEGYKSIASGATVEFLRDSEWISMNLTKFYYPDKTVMSSKSFLINHMESDYYCVTDENGLLIDYGYDLSIPCE